MADYGGFSDTQKKVERSEDRIAVHRGDYWKKYAEDESQFSNWRKHDIGDEGQSYRVAVKYKGEWVTYGFTFPRDSDGVTLNDRTLIAHNQEMYNILKSMKENNNLSGYSVEKNL